MKSTTITFIVSWQEWCLLLRRANQWEYAFAAGPGRDWITVSEKWEKTEGRVASSRPAHPGYKRQGELNA